MSNDIIKTEIYVEKNKVSVIRINNKEYISLTDLARYANPEEPKIPVQAWMRNKDVISYLGLWEKHRCLRSEMTIVWDFSKHKNSYFLLLEE